MTNSTPIHKMRVGLSVLTVTCLVAVVGYVMAGWSYIDAIYMVVITIFGVGYGEVNPVDHPYLKLFTLGVIVSGCSSAIYVLGGFVQLIAEGEIQRAIGAARMSQGIKELHEHAIICGFGRVGQSLVHDLQHFGIDVVVIDTNMERIAKAERKGILVICGDASQEETLQQAGIDRASVLATVLPGDSDNVFVTLTARELNESIDIIARCECESTERKLIRSGANRVVLPTVMGASRIAHLIACPTVETLVDDKRAFTRLNQDLDAFGLNMVEITATEGTWFVGRLIREIETSGDGGNVVVALKRCCGQINRNPKMDERVQADDTLFVLSHREDLAPLRKLLHPPVNVAPGAVTLTPSM